MKRLVEEVGGCGFEAILGERVVLVCGIYIYTGVLSGVNDDHLELTEPKLVYETGEWTAGPWKDAQLLTSPWRVMKQGIESWGIAKC